MASAAEARQVLPASAPYGWAPFVKAAAWTSALLPLVYELSLDSYLHLPAAIAYAVFMSMLVGIAGMALRVSARLIRNSLLLIIGVTMLVWAVPLTARERFARDVASIWPGMSRDEVGAVMAPHVTSILPSGVDIQGKTYFEAKWENHTFDNYCLVTWQQDRVAEVDFHED